MNKELKALKTPLRYPGGKSRATKFLLPKFPKEIEDYREPFIGGGSVAIEFTKQFPDASVWVNDLYEPLYNFWVQLQQRPDGLYVLLKAYKEENPEPDSARELFNQLKIDLNNPETTDLCKAAAFYVINKCSFSGLTESSSFSKQASVSNFSMKGIENLPKYSEIIKNWKITNLSYEHMLDGTPETFIYLDPPYDIKDNLYGKKGEMHKKFDHELFAKRMNFSPCKSLISYNSSLFVKDRFLGWGASTYELTYTMRSVGDYMDDQKDRAELLLFNYEV
jgi:site-specific DNA-adenine methylase